MPDASEDYEVHGEVGDLGMLVRSNLDAILAGDCERICAVRMTAMLDVLMEIALEEGDRTMIDTIAAFRKNVDAEA